jgi:alcohol dehydrogenase class IV
MKFIKINAVWCGACIVTNKVWKEVKKDYPDIAAALGYFNKKANEAENGLASFIKRLELSKNIENVTKTISGLTNAVNGLQ